MTDRHRITYRGSSMQAHRLVGELRDAGLEVDWEPPMERRDLGGAQAVVEVVLWVVIPGAAAASAAAGVDGYRKLRDIVSNWREKRRGEIDWREEDGYR